MFNRYINLSIVCPSRIFFSALAQGLLSSFPAGSEQKIATSASWGHALTSALAKLYTYTRARRPSRTLIDPLSAFVENFGQEGKNLDGAVQAAITATEKTRELDAKAGRSAYVESENLKKEKVPDPGAWGVKVILKGLTRK
jgi:dihydroxyacetone kinase